MDNFFDDEFLQRFSKLMRKVDLLEQQTELLEKKPETAEAVQAFKKQNKELFELLDEEQTDKLLEFYKQSAETEKLIIVEDENNPENPEIKWQD